MSHFSIYEYQNLSLEQQRIYNKAFAQNISSFLKEIKNDEVLKNIAIETFLTSSGECTSAAALVSEVYSRISSGIQVGSGNQNFFHSVLGAFTECWNVVTSK